MEGDPLLNGRYSPKPQWGLILYVSLFNEHQTLLSINYTSFIQPQPSRPGLNPSGPSLGNSPNPKAGVRVPSERGRWIMGRFGFLRAHIVLHPGLTMGCTIAEEVSAYRDLLFFVLDFDKQFLCQVNLSFWDNIFLIISFHNASYLISQT